MTEKLEFGISKAVENSGRCWVCTFINKHHTYTKGSYVGLVALSCPFALVSLLFARATKHRKQNKEQNNSGEKKENAARQSLQEPPACDRESLWL